MNPQPIARVQALGFSLWKRPFAKPYIATMAEQVIWSAQADSSVPVVTWGANEVVANTAPIIRMEDGFLHSCGLGSDLTPPMSQILDSKGIYFDARSPSQLTDMLNQHVFTEAELSRAEALREAICHAGLTKYNLGRSPVKWQPPQGKRVILVPGQVADDASVRFGSAQIKTMEALLQQVRSNHQDAFIVYKPHPDVLSGNRKGLMSASNTHYDVVDTEADIISLIEACDEVHTLSSLAGFDALLRGKKVVTYGRPFYAGWGLTTDIAAPLPFRSRTLSLQALVYASLILYPIYWDWRKGKQTTPEAVVQQLAMAASRPKKHISRAKRLWCNGMRWLRNITLYYLGKEYREG